MKSNYNIATLVFFGVLGVYAVNASMPSTAYRLPYVNLFQKELISILPQGWGFFTKSPREEEFFIYKKVNGVWANVFRGPSARLDNALGFDRTVRAQGIEFGMLSPPEDAGWVACAENDVKCLIPQSPRFSLKNPRPEPLICGNIGIVLREPIPWAFASKGFTQTKPGRSIVVKIACDA